MSRGKLCDAIGRGVLTRGMTSGAEKQRYRFQHNIEGQMSGTIVVLRHTWEGKLFWEDMCAAGTDGVGEGGADRHSLY